VSGGHNICLPIQIEASRKSATRWDFVVKAISVLCSAAFLAHRRLPTARNSANRVSLARIFRMRAGERRSLGSRNSSTGPATPRVSRSPSFPHEFPSGIWCLSVLSRVPYTSSLRNSLGLNVRARAGSPLKLKGINSICKRPRGRPSELAITVLIAALALVGDEPGISCSPAGSSRGGRLARTMRGRSTESKSMLRTEGKIAC
jgi:hypothetical protein